MGPPFVFGSPSQRFPITAHDDRSEHSDQSSSDCTSFLSRNDSGDAISDVSEDENERHVGLETSYEDDLGEREEADEVDDVDCY